MRTFVVHTVFLALTIIHLSGERAAAEEKRIALLIGNQAYRQGVGKLVNPFNDINLVGKALKKVGFEVMKPVTDATRAGILFAIHDFADKLKIAGSSGSEDIGFLYYSGHGVASLGENYIVPVDVAKPSTPILRVQGVRQSEIINILRTAAPRAAHYIVLDACRNTLQGKGGGKGFVVRPDENGMLIAYAAAPNRTASDDGESGGPYATALAAELVKPNMSDLIMFHRVRIAVKDKTNGDQVPWTQDGIQRTERIYFGGRSKSGPATPAATQPSTAPPRPPVSREAEAWAAIKDLNSPGVFEEYIKRFPNGFYAGFALARLNELKAAKPKPKQDEPKVTIGTFPEEPKAAPARKPFEPEMVRIPGGTFQMGCVSGKDCGDYEKPVHSVTIKAFEMGKYEVSFDEWDACVARGGCNGYRPKDLGWGRGKRPVINVSWEDAQAYVKWLRKETGKDYQLPTEAEWEYAAQAGTTTAFPWGNKAGHDYANYGKNECCDGLAKGADKWVNTAPVGSFGANAFNLHDMHGNVWEWVEDCWHDSYRSAPSDGSAWLKANGGDCAQRVLQGGSWGNRPPDLRSAYRGRGTADDRSSETGFVSPERLPLDSLSLYVWGRSPRRI